MIITGNVKERKVFVSHERIGNTIYEVITDAQTGEIIHEGWITETKNKPGIKRDRSAYFIKLYRTNLIQIIKEKRLSFVEAGAFLSLLSIAGWQTPYIVNPETGKNMSCSEIAEYLNMDRKYIQNLLDRLVSKGMLSKVLNGNGRSNHYMINPNVAFYGKTIDDINHLEIFKTCSYEPKVYIRYRKTPEKSK